MAWMALAAEAIKSGEKTANMPVAPDVFSPHTPINVAPVGVNIGEILKGPNSGASTNGGQPISARLGRPSNRGAQHGMATLPVRKTEQSGGNAALLGYGGLAAGGLLVAWLMIR